MGLLLEMSVQNVKLDLSTYIQLISGIHENFSLWQGSQTWESALNYIFSYIKSEFSKEQLDFLELMIPQVNEMHGVQPGQEGEEK